MRRRRSSVLARLAAVAMLAAGGVAMASAVKTIRIHTVGGEAPPAGARTFAPDSTRAALDGHDVTDDGSLDALPYEPGKIVLRLSPELASSGSTIEGRGTSTSFGIDALDRIGRRYGVRSIRRPFAGRDARAAARGAALRRRSTRARPGAVAPGFETVHVVEISPFLDMDAVAREYAAVDGVLWAEPVRKVQAVMVTNDPYMTSSGSWGQSYPDLWGLEKVDAPSAWDVTRGAGVIVAVTDTGLDASHPDISQRVWTNTGEIAGNGIDDDGNGYVDDTSGWNFVAADNDPFDDNGHGTHVSGIVAAQGNNGTGIVGVAWESQVMPLKGLSASGSGSTTELAEAILYAVDNGADVINASWGGAGSSDLIDDAVDAATAAGVVFVAAAGNSATDVSTFFPASNPHVIAVSAFDSTDTVAFFSNFGAGIDVAAPGGGDTLPSSIYDPFRSVLSLLSSGANSELTGGNKLKVGSLYLRQAGTSMAAPYVAGAAALVLANHPAFTVEQVRQVLRASADDVDSPGVDANAGYGRINVGAAMAIDDVLEVTIDSPISGDTVSTNQLSVLGSVRGTGFASYSVEYGEGAYPSQWTTIVGPVTTPVTAGELAVWDTTSVADGPYALRVRGTTAAGDVFEDRVQLTLDRVIITDPTSYSIHRGGGVQLPIVGTAYAPGMESFVVEYRAIEPDLTEGAWTSAGLTATGGGTQPIFEDVLATFDTSVLPAGRDLDLRLTVNGSAGQTTDTFYHIVVDPDLRPGWPVRIPGLPNRYSRMQGHMTLADLDNDGTKEILAGYGDLVFVFSADGSDFPGWPQSMADPDPDFTAFTDAAPAAADLDNDGKLEVVSGNYRSVFVWHSDGTPMAGWPKEFIYQPDYYVRGAPSGNFTLVDLDGDGTRDILFGWGAAVAAVHTDGTFLPGWPPTIESIYLSPPPLESVLAAGDMNGDDKPEVAIVESAGTRSPQYLHVFDGLGRETLGYPVKITHRRFSDNWPILADLDGNGLLDVITNRDNPKRLNAYNWEGRKVRLRTKVPAYKYRYPGAGKFKSAQELLSAGDITGDGRPEIFVSTEWPQVRIRCRGIMCTWTFLLGPYTGTSYVQAVSASERQIAGWPRQLDFRRGDNAHGPGSAAIGDIDGDGSQDVVLGTGMCWAAPDYEYHRCYTILAYHADGTPLPGFPKPTPSPGATQAVMPAIGDLDGDGLKEIVWVDFDGNVLVWTVPGTPGPENMQWPMFRHDAAHTGALR